jgi:hypothetical protein
MNGKLLELEKGVGHVCGLKPPRSPMGEVEAFKIKDESKVY